MESPDFCFEKLVFDDPKEKDLVKKIGPNQDGTHGKKSGKNRKHRKEVTKTSSADDNNDVFKRMGLPFLSKDPDARELLAKLQLMNEMPVTLKGLSQKQRKKVHQIAEKMDLVVHGDGDDELMVSRKIEQAPMSKSWNDRGKNFMSRFHCRSDDVDNWRDNHIVQDTSPARGKKTHNTPGRSNSTHRSRAKSGGGGAQKHVPPTDPRQPKGPDGTKGFGAGRGRRMSNALTTPSKTPSKAIPIIDPTTSQPISVPVGMQMPARSVPAPGPFYAPYPPMSPYGSPPFHPLQGPPPPYPPYGSPPWYPNNY